MGVAGSVDQVIGCSFVGGLGNGIEAITMLTLIQELTSEPFQARVSGLVESMHLGAPGLGYLLGGVLAAALSPRAAYLIAGMSTLLVVAIAARSPRTRLGSSHTAGARPRGSGRAAGDLAAAAAC
jgi:MFS family permease